MKKTFGLLLGLLLSIALTISAFAGEWKLEANGKWWYLNDDGSYPQNTWQLIDGKYYYFDAEGYLLVNTTTPDGYWVGADGAWVQSTASVASTGTSYAVVGSNTNLSGGSAVVAANAGTYSTAGNNIYSIASNSSYGTTRSSGSSSGSSVTGTVYWTPGGDSYHTTSGCRSLARSNNIYSGSLEEAKRAGKTDPCNNCVR